MTKDEAIELLRDLDGAIEDNHGRDYDEAFRMAIESLSADEEHGFRGGKIPPKEMLNGTVLIPKHQWLEMERELAELKSKFESAEPNCETCEWIPVSESLPSEDGCYLVSTTGTNNDIIDIAYYTEEIWHKASRIKAWMPLPKPYREDGEA